MADFEMKDDEVSPEASGEKPISALKADMSNPGIKAAADTQAQADRLATTSKVVGTATAVAQGVVGAIPFGHKLQTKIAQLFGEDPAQTVRMQHQVENQHPVASAIGTGIGGGVVGAATAGLGGIAAGGIAGGAAVAASEAGLLTPIYKLGEIANQADLQPHPLSVEQIGHAFDLDDVMQAAGLTVLLHAPGMLGAGAGALAERSAGKAMKNAAVKLKMTPRDAGRLALDTGVMEEVGNAKRLMDASGAQMGEAAKAAQVDTKVKRDIVQSLMDVAKQAPKNSELNAAMKDLSASIEGIIDDKTPTGERMQDQIQALKALARKARRAGSNKAADLHADAAAAAEDVLIKHIETVNPEAGAQYRRALSDNNMYRKLAPDADKAAAKRLTGSDIALAAGAMAAAHEVGGMGGPVAQVAGDVALAAAGANRLRSKNAAVMLNKISKISPGNLAAGRMNATVEALLQPTLSASIVGTQDDMERYDSMAHMLRNHVANPDAAARSLRQSVDFLPSATADALTANTMEKLNKMCAELPAAQGPATAFGIQTHPSDRQKREFLRKCDAKFDPYAAVLTGRKDLIQEAERCNPETVHAIKQAVIDKISQNPEGMDYMTKRKVCGILGLPGVPGQDPAIGARIGAAMNVRKQAQDAQGQMKSARQANASLKNNSATLTRAQRILNTGE